MRNKKIEMAFKIIQVSAKVKTHATTSTCTGCPAEILHTMRFKTLCNALISIFFTYNLNSNYVFMKKKKTIIPI